MNRVILIGRLGADPELRQTTGGQVCNLRVATSERWTDKSGQRQERTEWHSVAVWGAQAEHCARYLHKGSQVAVEGSLQSRKYTDQSGGERVAWDIRATSVQFLDPKGAAPASGGGWDEPEQREAPAGRWSKAQASEDDDDPIPF